MIRCNALMLTAGLFPMASTPAFPQAAIDEPGMSSFVYPNRDVLSGGAPTPEYFLEKQMQA